METPDIALPDTYFASESLIAEWDRLDYAAAPATLRTQLNTVRDLALSYLCQMPDDDGAHDYLLTEIDTLMEEAVQHTGLSESLEDILTTTVQLVLALHFSDTTFAERTEIQHYILMLDAEEANNNPSASKRTFN